MGTAEVPTCGNLEYWFRNIYCIPPTPTAPPSMDQSGIHTPLSRVWLYDFFFFLSQLMKMNN